MARVLEGSELEEALSFMDRAVELSMSAPCKRDQRGVVIVKNGNIIGEGVNSPPQGYSCEPKYCEPTCKYYAVHAEINAMADANRKGFSVLDARMYHARGENGVLQPSRDPKCYLCSKELVSFGIGEFVLMHKEGLTLYGIEEFNRISLENHMK